MTVWSPQKSMISRSVATWSAMWQTRKHGWRTTSARSSKRQGALCDPNYPWSKLQSPQKMNSGLWEDWGCRTASRVEEWLGEPEIFPVSFSSLLEDSCWKFGSCCFWCTKSKICVPSQISVFLKVRARKSFPPLLIPAGDESIVFMVKLRPQFGDTSKITLEYGRHCPCPPGVYKNYKTWWWIIFRFIFLVGGSVDFHPLDEVRKPLAAWGPWTCAWVACREDRSKNWWICRRRKAAQS